MTPTDKMLKDLMILIMSKGMTIEELIRYILHISLKDISPVSRSNIKRKVFKLLELDEYNEMCKFKKEKLEIRKIKNREYVAKYYEENRKILNEKRRLYTNNKRQEDELFKLKHVVRNRILNSFNFKGLRKSEKTEEILGCSFEFFMSYIESKFHDGMTWSNRGVHGWHIDHIVPLATANNRDEIIALNHYTNLQPLWAKDNLKKGSKIMKDATL